MASELIDIEDPVSTLRNQQPPYLPAWRQREFTGWRDEQLSWKETCYIGDWSFLEDLRLSGPDARTLLDDWSVNRYEGFPVGSGKHIINTDDEGYVIAEGVVVRRSEDEYAIYSFPAWWIMYQATEGDYDVETSLADTFNFQIQGPASLDVLEDAADGPLAEIGFMELGTVTIDGHEVNPLRMGMAGEVGFELQGPASVADEVWNAVLAAGEPHGIRQLGARTAMINHLEACFPTVGKDYLPAIFGPEMAPFRSWLIDQGAEARLAWNAIRGSLESTDITDWYRNPVELGWGAVVDPDGSYPGSQKLAAELEDPQRTMVTLEWDRSGVIEAYASLFEDGEAYEPMDMPTEQFWAMRADGVYDDGDLVGVATSRGYSYWFRRMLSLCTIDTPLAEPGTTVTVRWGDPDGPQLDIDATVAPAPYKEDRRRAPLVAAE